MPTNPVLTLCALPDILQEASSSGGAPYKVLIDLARLQAPMGLRR